MFPILIWCDAVFSHESVSRVAGYQRAKPLCGIFDWSIFIPLGYYIKGESELPILLQIGLFGIIKSFDKTVFHLMYGIRTKDLSFTSGILFNPKTVKSWINRREHILYCHFYLLLVLQNPWWFFGGIGELKTSNMKKNLLSGNQN